MLDLLRLECQKTLRNIRDSEMDGCLFRRFISRGKANDEVESIPESYGSTVFDAFRIEQTFAYGERVLDGSQTF